MMTHGSGLEDEHRPLMTPKQRARANEKRRRWDRRLTLTIEEGQGEQADTPSGFLGWCTCCSNRTKTATLVAAMVVVATAFALSFYSYYEGIRLSEPVALGCLAGSGGLFGVLVLVFGIHLGGMHRRAKQEAFLRQSAWTRHLFTDDRGDAGASAAGERTQGLPGEQQQQQQQQHRGPRHGEEHRQRAQAGDGADDRLERAHWVKPTSAGRQGTHDDSSTVDSDMSEPELFQEVHRLARQLKEADAAGNDEAVRLILEELDARLMVTESLLAATGIGRAVNGLRGACRPQAQALVKKWMAAVQQCTHENATGAGDSTRETALSSAQQEPRAPRGGNTVSQKEMEDEDEAEGAPDEGAIMAALSKLNGRLVAAARAGDDDQVHKLLAKLKQGQEELTLERLSRSGLWRTLRCLRDSAGAEAQLLLRAAGVDNEVS